MSLEFEAQLWLMGGKACPQSPTSESPVEPEFYNDVWRSADGRNWTMQTHAAQWAGRARFSALAFDGKLWILGGENAENDAYSDVWFSSDGETWNLATDSAPWGERLDHTSVVFDGRMWVIGGRVRRVLPWVLGAATQIGDANDVWSSADGVDWALESDGAPWLPRSAHASTVFDGAMWVIGGGNSQVGTLNDVWRSDDGITWELMGTGEWQVRRAHAAVVHNNAIYVVGGIVGSGHDAPARDIWLSGDGITWSLAGKMPIPSAIYQSSVVFDDQIWLFGGQEYYAEYDKPYGIYNHAWSSPDGGTWTGP